MSSEDKKVVDSSFDPLSKSHLKLWLKILRASRVIETELRDKFKSRFNSTLPRFDVMAALYRYEEGLKMNELSGVLRVSNGNVTGIIDRLVADEFVIRMGVPGDRRASIVKLTSKGKEEFSIQAKEHEEWIGELFKLVSHDDTALLATELDLIIESVTRNEK